MDDLLENWVDRIINRLKSRLQEVFEVFDIEQAMPLHLNGKQCQKLLGIGNYEEFLRVTHLPGFPKIEKGKGAQVRYPRDAVRDWYRENWNLI